MGVEGGDGIPTGIISTQDLRYDTDSRFLYSLARSPNQKFFSGKNVPHYAII